MIRVACLVGFSLFFGLVFAGCATTAPQARKSPSNAKILVVVDQSTLLGPGLAEETESNLKQFILDAKAGVPVTSAGNADLILNVKITSANFTHATAWEWSLVDVDNDTIVFQKNDSSLMGAGGDTVARGVVEAMNTLELDAYSSSSNTAVAAQQVEAPQAAAFPQSATDGSNAWAVVVGIESYRENLPDADAAEADARAFAELARTTLNVPEQNIKLLIGDRASRADMSAAIFEWLPRNAVQPGGRVYVFFSGHGSPDVQSGDAYLLPYDANPTYIKSGGLPIAAVQKTLSDLHGQQVYVFLDSCFSGSGERSVLPEGTRPVVPVKKIEPTTNVVTLSAAGPDETTGAHASRRHGLFTFHLLKGLSGVADADSDSNVSVDELHAHVQREVSVEARRQNRDQTPTLASGGDGSRPLVAGVQ